MAIYRLTDKSLRASAGRVAISLSFGLGLPEIIFINAYRRCWWAGMPTL
ncbi:MAG: hypothetical protein J6T41_04150 [Neisseriaceae bacterium]|nr:hypothetical protein [Neisseriaceae bacterium]